MFLKQKKNVFQEFDNEDDDEDDGKRRRWRIRQVEWWRLQFMIGHIIENDYAVALLLSTSIYIAKPIRSGTYVGYFIYLNM